jgi:hypothetical protein
MDEFGAAVRRYSDGRFLVWWRGGGGWNGFAAGGEGLHEFDAGAVGIEEVDLALAVDAGVGGEGLGVGLGGG